VALKDTSPDLLDLWRAFKKTGSEKLRNQLVESYLHLARRAARRMASRLPPTSRLEDLESAAIVGLLDAIHTYNPSTGVWFWYFARPRIEGAILDELRRQDPFPRRHRTKLKKRHIQLQKLEQSLGRRAHPHEVDSALGPLSQKDAFLNEAAASLPHSGNFSQDDAFDLVATFADEKETEPWLPLYRGEIKQLVSKNLSPTERIVIFSYYFKEKSMKEIGRSLGITESRVSQLHSQALSRLKRKLSRRKSDLL
jgi:RNA polymerase sigma factor for flagellar operon FliA